MSATEIKLPATKPSKYAATIEHAIGRLEGLQAIVKPTGSIRAMLETLCPYFDAIERLSGKDKVVLKAVLKSICPGYPFPVAVEREDLVTIFEGAEPDNAMSILLGVLVTVDHWTNRAASFNPKKRYDWYRAHEQFLIADWWRQILSDMFFLRPKIFQDDLDEIIRKLQLQ